MLVLNCFIYKMKFILSTKIWDSDPKNRRHKTNTYGEKEDVLTL